MITKIPLLTFSAIIFNRCRCKVGLDMQNNYEYRPNLKKCHLLHFNDNKYRFQSRRMKHQYDRGDVTAVNPITYLFAEEAGEQLPPPTPVD